VRRGAKMTIQGSEHEGPGRPVRAHALVVCCLGVGISVRVMLCVQEGPAWNMRCTCAWAKRGRGGWGKRLMQVLVGVTTVCCPALACAMSSCEGMVRVW